MSTSPNTTAFISGHRDITKQEFEENYIPLILDALDKGIKHFLIGDYEGVDTLAQNYLKELLLTNKGTFTISIYHMNSTPMFAIPNVLLVGNFLTDEERDSAMTTNSSIDIAWIRKGKETSGTAQNLARRIDPSANIYKE